MPSPESRPGGGGHEQEPVLYYRAARFPSEKPAGRAYRAAQESVFAEREQTDLSVYRLALNRDWYVTVLGEPPPAALEAKLTGILARGEPATLPEDLLQVLAERRREATRLGPWVERHAPPPRDSTP
jgi:hypothetical protein